MANNRMGCMGHYYSGMLDIYSDLTMQYAYLGGHIELIEVDELTALRKGVLEKDVQQRVKYFYEASILNLLFKRRIKKGGNNVFGS
jgi:L-arabinose isomerase